MNGLSITPETKTVILYEDVFKLPYLPFVRIKYCIRVVDNDLQILLQGHKVFTIDGIGGWANYYHNLKK